MDLRPLGIKRTRWQTVLSWLPYLIGGYLIALVVAVIIAGWFG